jgi:hypothetical protein
MMALFNKFAILLGTVMLVALLAQAQQSAETTAPDAAAAQHQPVSPEPTQAEPPEISYQNNQLQITAQNSTLGDVLTLVAKRTGAVIEGPMERANERVAVKLGPAPASEVLSRLLQGSRFDYVILGSAASPGAVDKIVLSQRAPASSAAVQSARSAPSPAEEEPAIEEDPGMTDLNPPPGETGAPPSPGALLQQQQGLEGQPGAPPLPGQNPAEFPPGGPPGPEQLGQSPESFAGQNVPGTDDSGSGSQQQPKTPEQLLRELQIMQQQEQLHRQGP